MLQGKKVTVKEAAWILRYKNKDGETVPLNPSRVHHLIKAKRFESAKKIGHAWFIDHAEVVRFSKIKRIAGNPNFGKYFVRSRGKK